MKLLPFRLFLLSFMLLTFGSVWGQLDYRINSYKPTDYHSAPQVRAIAQDSNSLFYFALKTGVLVFDGERWDIIGIGDEEAVWSLKEERGRIYVGTDNDFGFLQASDTAPAEFVSLSPDSVVGQVERILFDTKGSGYFQSSNKIYTIYEDKTERLSCISDTAKISFCFLVGEELYVQLEKAGLNKLVDGKLQPVSIGYDLVNNKILAHAEFNGEHFFAIDGVGLLSGKELHRLSPIDGLKFSTDMIHTLTPCGNNLLAAGTYGEGVYLLDRNFSLVKNINTSRGLNDGVVSAQLCDADGNLWVGSNYGLNSILINTAVTSIILKDHGLSSIEDIIEYQNELYLATQSGAYRMVQNQNTVSFYKIPVTDNDTYGLLNFDTGIRKLLMIAMNDAICYWSGEKMHRLADCGPYGLIEDATDSNRLFVGNYNGLSSIRWDGTSFTDEGYFSGADLDIPSMAYSKEGTLYLGTQNDGMYSCVVEGSQIEVAQIPLFKGAHVSLKRIGEEMFAGTDKGLYRQNTTGWEKLTLSAEACSFEEYGVHRVFQFSDELVGLALYNGFDFELGCWSFDGTAHPLNHDLKLYRSLPHAGFTDNRGKCWLGGNDRLICIDTKFEHGSPGVRKAAIRSFNVAGEQRFAAGVSALEELMFNFGASTYTFNFYLNDFSSPQENRYSYKLIGQDTGWSAWSTQPFASYTNLSEGSYELLVRGKTALGEPTETASIRFEVLPPWYRTWWAYSAYFILFLFVIRLLVQLQTKRLKARQAELEEEVNKATVEIRNQKDEIESLFEEVTDSIRYAKHIQNSILPSDELMKQAFPDHFVLYKPKDIVSGDFYWASIINGKSYVAAVDCTGHGVPGAFMSMLGASGLNNAVNDQTFEKPGEILDALSSYAYSNLNKGEKKNHANDGMDMSLVAIDGVSGTMETAGAFNPIVVVRDQELTTIKGDRYSIGSNNEKGLFQTRTMDLQKGDMIYLFSDGYQDQFGGEKGKKFMTKNLKLLFKQIAAMDVHRQKNELQEALEKWKGELEQIDDILVIGILFN